MNITIDDLEFENGMLTKVKGMRPQYMDGHKILATLHGVAALLAPSPVDHVATGEDDMPERIWAGDFDAQGFGHCVAGMQGGLYSEYVRADLVPPASDVVALKKAAEAVRPLADAVFNDNGDMTVSIPLVSSEDCIQGYFASKRITAALAASEGSTDAT